MFRDRRQERQAEAEERRRAREKRGDAGQLSKLERSGHGHCREADRLREKLARVAEAQAQREKNAKRSKQRKQ